MLYKERNPKYIAAYHFISLEELGNRFEEIQPGHLFFNKERNNEHDRCPNCGKYLKDHAIIQGINAICPGSYILEQLGRVTGSMSASNFEELYIPIGEIVEEK